MDVRLDPWQPRRDLEQIAWQYPGFLPSSGEMFRREPSAPTRMTLSALSLPRLVVR